MCRLCAACACGRRAPFNARRFARFFDPASTNALDDFRRVRDEIASLMPTLLA